MEWQQLPVGTILMTKKKYYEVIEVFDSGDYSISQVEANTTMFIEDAVIHLGIEDGSWKVIK